MTSPLRESDDPALVELGKNRRESVIVILRPTVERMIVAVAHRSRLPMKTSLVNSACSRGPATVR